MALVIRTCEVTRLDLPLHAPFGIAGGEQDLARNVLLRLELADGAVGWGEAAPLPAYNGETQEQALAVLQPAAGWLIGSPVEDWRVAAREFHDRAGRNSGAAQGAFEMALLDALARGRGEPLWRFFGGAGTTLRTDLTITTGTVAAAGEAAAAARARGFRRLKLKIGGAAGPAHDLARVAAVTAAHPEAELLLDGNAGLGRPAAAELIAGLRRSGVRPVLLEQWLAPDDLAGAAALARETGWPVAADESAVSPADVLRLAHAGAAQVINVKLMKAGIATALDVVGVARGAGLGLMIGGNVESVLAMTVAAAFAAGAGGFCHVDLDTPLFLATNPFQGGMRYDGEVITVDPVAAGHGVEPAPGG